MVLALGMCSIGANAQKRTRQVESDGFVWYEVEKDAHHIGAEDANGRTLIPTQYFSVFYHAKKGNMGYFTVWVGSNYENKSVGVYTKNGTNVIPASRGYYEVNMHIEDEGYYFGVKKNGKEGACDANGREIIAPQYESLFYSSSDQAFNYKNSSGKYVNTGISLTGGTSSYASSSSTSSSSDNSSSSSLASSTSSQTSSSSSSTQPKWNHQGWYLDMYDDRGFVQKQQITFYDDRMEIRNENSIKKGTCYTIPYYGMQNGWKLYRKEENYGPPLDKVVEDYYVNSSYDVKHLSTGTHFSTVERPMVKDGENINSYVRMTNSPSGGFSGGTSAGYSSGGSSGTGSSSNIPRPKCPNCVNGRKVYESTVPYSGTQIRYSTCSECGLRYQSSHRTHRHEQCTTCHGKGYLD